MISRSYMNRALRSSDPRYARVLEKLGYGRRDMQAAEPVSAVPTFTDLDTAREEYRAVVGKQPYHGWDVATLRKKIATAKKKAG